MKREFIIGEKYDAVYTPTKQALENGHGQLEIQGLNYQGTLKENEDVTLHVFRKEGTSGIFIDDDFVDMWEVSVAEEDEGDYLDAQEFYEVMQGYRTADHLDQENVISWFEAVKDFIREKSSAKELMEACEAMINTKNMWFPGCEELKEKDCGERENTLFAMVHKLESAIKKASQ